MKNKNRLIIAGTFVLIVIVGFMISLRFNEGKSMMQKSLAIVAGSWQNLFGSATYDVSIDENASDSADFSSTSTLFDGSTTFEQPSDDIPPLPAEKASSTKKKTSSNDLSPDPSGAQKVSSSDAAENFSQSTPIDITSIVSSSCSFPASVNSTTQKIILNEIAWMGSPPANGETASAAANDEWIELKNISGTDITLGGWSVLDHEGDIKINFAAGDHIASGGFFLLVRGEQDQNASLPQKTYSGNLSNSGDEMAVLDPQCGISDILDASAGWPGGDNTTKQTLERNGDAEGWHTSSLPGGTPGLENSAGVVVQGNVSTTTIATTTVSSSPGAVGSGLDSGASSSTETSAINTTSTSATTTPSEASDTSETIACSPVHLVIAAIQIAGPSSSNDFVKIYNPTGASVDMTGWKLRKKSQTGTDSSLKALGAGSVVLPGAYFIWANSSGGFAQSIGADTSSTETLAANNSVALLDASGTIIDEVAWGIGTNQYVEGIAFATNPIANQLLERNTLGGAIIDTDDNATDFTLH